MERLIKKVAAENVFPIDDAKDKDTFHSARWRQGYIPRKDYSSESHHASLDNNCDITDAWRQENSAQHLIESEPWRVNYWKYKWGMILTARTYYKLLKLSSL